MPPVLNIGPTSYRGIHCPPDKLAGYMGSPDNVICVCHGSQLRSYLLSVIDNSNVTIKILCCGVNKWASDLFTDVRTQSHPDSRIDDTDQILTQLNQCLEGVIVLRAEDVFPKRRSAARAYISYDDQQFAKTYIRTEEQLKTFKKYIQRCKREFGYCIGNYGAVEVVTQESCGGSQSLGGSRRIIFRHGFSQANWRGEGGDPGKKETMTNKDEFLRQYYKL